jgi:putative hydrolase
MKIIGDLHTHTVASGHAFSTLKENAEEAARCGMLYLGMSDHCPAMVPIDESYFHTMKVLPREINGVKILRSAEADILDGSGKIDLSDEVMEKRMDFVIASLHSPIFPQGDKKYCTKAVINTMKNRSIRIIGHPDDSRFPLDYGELVEAALDNEVILELNNASFTPYAYRENGVENARIYLELCEKKGVRIIVSSDSHVYTDVGKFPYALKILEEAGFPEDLVVNASAERLMDFLAAKPSAPSRRCG